jgi:hypothetical protein
MRRAIFCALVLCSGCADVKTIRLETGSECLVYHAMYEGEKSKSTVLHAGKNEGIMGMYFLDPGTKVRIIVDDAEDTKLGRRVKVRVLEGEHAGKTGEIDRAELRPIPRP